MFQYRAVMSAIMIVSVQISHLKHVQSYLHTALKWNMLNKK